MKHTAAREVIERLYVQEGRMLEDVADTLGMSRPALRRIMREYGIPARPKGTMYRIDDLIQKQPNGCWEWTGLRNRLGYGRVNRGYRVQLVHRVIYERERGPIPAGLELDHLCRNPPCCNPDHLEAVTHAVNMQRGWDARKAARCDTDSGGISRGSRAA